MTHLAEGLVDQSSLEGRIHSLQRKTEYGAPIDPGLRFSAIAANKQGDFGIAAEPVPVMAKDRGR